jgi:Family of unknown function (DUF6064)
MSEWWSYTLSDFLLFSPRTYYRLLERYNEALWPAQILALGVGLGIFGLLRRPGEWRGRLIAAILAMLWGWIGWAFLWKRYATINWAAIYLVPLFALQVLLLLWTGVVRPRLVFRSGRQVAGLLGTALLFLSLALYPIIAPVSGRPWRQAEIFGVAPDPTTIATLGVLLLSGGQTRWELLAVPVLWCLISGATLWALRSPEAWVPPLAALLAIAVSIRRQRKPDESAVVGPHRVAS